VTDGIEIVIEPGRAGLSPEQLRQFVRAVMTAYNLAKQELTTSQPTKTDAS
jgi:hypothetical protein